MLKLDMYVGVISLEVMLRMVDFKGGFMAALV
jgi:hypothetical protein